MTPELTLVIPALESFDVIAPVLDSVLHQTARERISIVLVTGDLEYLAAPEWVEASGCFLLECPRGSRIEESRAWAIERCETQWIGLLEDHVVLEADWAEKVLAKLTGDYAVVGTAVLPGNPGSLPAGASFLLSYAEWTWPCESGSREFLPGHNSVYRTDLLLERGPTLIQELGSAGFLHKALRDKGHDLYLVGDTYFRHFEAVGVSGACRIAFCAMLMTGHLRTRSWVLPLRLGYAACFALVALLHWRRALRSFCRSDARYRMSLGSLLFAVLVSVFWGLGEAVGSLCGRELSTKWGSRAEIDRWRFLDPADRPLVSPPS